MNQGRMVFANGFESDRMEFLDGHTVRIGVANDTLNLLVPAGEGAR